MKSFLIVYRGRIENLENVLTDISERQNQYEAEIKRIGKIVDTIEKDIYEDNDYDLEIVCPYCNYTFTMEPDETEDEIQCPECNNLIEIDWDGESFEEGECSGSCGGCGHHCGEEFDENDDDM